MRVAEKRFRPQYRVAFVAWLATHPFTNPNAPAGPQLMPQYVPTGEALSRTLDANADAYYAKGEKAAERATCTSGSRSSSRASCSWSGSAPNFPSTGSASP